jgi:hypothetical protein
VASDVEGCVETNLPGARERQDKPDAIVISDIGDKPQECGTENGRIVGSAPMMQKGS